MATPVCRVAGGLSLNESYTRQERAQIADALRAHEPVLVCPRCHTQLNTSPVPPTPGVSYVRKRALVFCPKCHITSAVDLPRI
jgi:hypothetical protein